MRDEFLRYSLMLRCKMRHQLLIVAVRRYSTASFAATAPLIRSTEKDAVTGLFTRDYFFEYIRQIEAHFKNTIDALVFNIDHFHLVNEMYGRNTGDSILMRVAEALEEVLRPNAIISCRTEADTFYVYCAHIEDYAPLVAKIQEKLGNVSGSSKIRLRLGIFQEADDVLDLRT